jgi:FKBP-type peptidyl-prolyl cis-trans isomerase
MRPLLAVLFAAAIIPLVGCFDDPKPTPTGSRNKSGRRQTADYKEREWARPPLNAPEWKKLPSGLEVWDVKEGTGDPAQPGGYVWVHYTGWLTDDAATKFDSSVDRGQESDFSLGRVIKGWQEGIPGMKPGGIRRLKIPADLAYGSEAKPKIPSNSTLVFEVELLGTD